MVAGGNPELARGQDLDDRLGSCLAHLQDPNPVVCVKRLV
jgi:hypothetical protein